MYKLLEERSNILGYRLESEPVFFQKRNENEFTFSTSKFSRSIDTTVFGNPFSWGKFFIFSNPNTRKSSFWIDGEEIKQTEFYSLGASNKFLIASYKKERKECLQILNKDFETIFEKEFKVGGHQYLNPDLFVCSEYLKADKVNIFKISDSVSFSSVELANNNWTTSEREEVRGRVFQLLGYWNTQLLVFIGKFRILSIDINTGKELWRIEDFMKEVSTNPILNFSDGAISVFIKWQLDETEGRAYLLVRNYLFELSLEEKESRLVKDYNEADELEWDFKKSRLYGDVITFAAANKLGSPPSVAGVIDKDTKKILWTAKCENGIYYDEAPQIKDNKLYVLASNNTLYVFEREESNV
jgi:hypothetical protein